MLDTLEDYCKFLGCDIVKDIGEDYDKEGYYKIYALGKEPDLRNWVVGRVYTPWFKTKNELLKWCKSNEIYTWQVDILPSRVYGYEFQAILDTED